MPRYTGLFIFSFVFFISIANKFSEKYFIVWQLGSDANWFLPLSFATNLISLCFLTFYTVFPKTALLISLKKFFSKSIFASALNSVFRPIYGFNHAFWLNWITLCTFLSINPWFNNCFKAPMSAT